MKRAILILALAALLVPGGALALFELPSIKNKLIDLALEQISSPGSFEITAEGVEDGDDGATSLTGVSVSDGQGAWLTLERLTFNWEPDRLLSGELAISRLELIGLTVSRPPSEDAEPPELKPQEPWAESIFDWPRSPIALTIDGVRLERVSIAEGVLPQAIRFDATARAFDKGDIQDLALALDRTDDVQGTIRVTMKRDFAANTLTVGLEANEAAGGMVAAAAGLSADRPARLSLKADGPVTDWRLDFDASVERLVTATGQATLKNTDALAVDADFTVTPGPDLADELGQELQTVLGDQARLTARIVERGDGMIEIEAGNLSSPALNLTASGAYATGEGDSDLAVQLTALAPLADLAEGVTFDRFGFDGQVTGPKGGLAANGKITLTGLATAPVDAASMSLDGQVTQTADGAVFDLDGKAEALRIDKIGPAVIGVARLGLDGALAGDLLTLEQFELTSEALTAGAAGNYDLAAESGALTLDVSAPEIAPIAAAYGAEAEGIVAAKVDVILAGEKIDADLNAELNDFAFQTIRARALTLSGKVGQAAGRLSFDVAGTGADLVLDKVPADLTHRLDLFLNGAMAGETVTLERLSLTSPLLLAEASGQAALGDQRLGIEYRVTTADLAPVARAYGLDASGALEARGSAEGDLAAPRVAGRVAMQRAAYAGTSYGTVALEHDVAVAPAPEGRLTLSVSESPAGAAEAATMFRLDGPLLAISDLTARALGASVTGRAHVNIETTLADAELDVAIADLRPLGGFAGTPLAGSLSGPVTLTSVDGRQDVAADLRVKAFATEGAQVGSARVKLAVADALGTPRIDLAAEAGGIGADVVELTRARASVMGPLTALDFAADGDGRLLDDLPLTLDLAGRADARGDPVAVTVARLKVTADQDAVELRQPLRLRLGGGLVEARGLDLALPGNGTLSGDAAMRGGGLAGKLALARLNLDILERWADVPVQSGVLDASADFDTGRSRAKISAQVHGLGFDKTQDAAEDLDADLAAAWEGAKIDANAEVRGNFGDPLRAQVTLPVRRGANGLPQPTSRGTLAGSVTWRGRLGNLWAMVPAPGHVLDGDLDIDLTLAGTFAEPRYGGRADLNDGQYQNLDAGTILTDLTLRTELAEDGAMRVSVEGSDGTHDKAVQAEMRLDAAEGLPAIDLTARIDRAILVRRDDVTAQITGDLAMAGPVNDMRLSGAITIDKAEVRLVNKTPPTVVDLEGIHIKGAPEKDGNGDGESALTLDLTIAAKRDIFVRGRGLDSEWGMDLAVTGDAASPVIAGTIERIRGQLDLLGRPFELARGKITFDGGSKIDPILDISLEREEGSLRGGILVEGRAANPEIRFASIPALPESEVLPRLLFGQSSQSLTGPQALQLATGVATLMGGGPGVLDKVRGVTGLDVLRVEGESVDDAAVTVGRNIGEGIFVGASQGLGGQGSTVTVEVEVFDGVVVDTEVGQAGNTSAGISLRKDF